MTTDGNPSTATSSSQSCTTSSDESWSAASKWLEDCLTKHVTCNQNQTKAPWYPTRLLDVGDVESDDELIRLIHTADLESLSGPYCTLSHCWGKAHFIQLNRHTAISLHCGFALDKMPKTFREAISISRRLGIRYIWIDSLCIVQDDRADWFREAAQMHKVYSRSHCNISASASVDSSEGLFRQRNQKVLEISQVELCVSDVDPDRQHALCEVFDYFFWTNNVSRCTINKRAWVSTLKVALQIKHGLN